MLAWNLAALAGLGFLHTATAKGITCNANAIPKPEHFGISVTNIEAKEVKDWNRYHLFGLLSATAPTESIEFCNVTVTYTHPGLGDKINVYVWLPLDGWNGRLVAQGGGGMAAGAEGMDCH